MLLLSNWRRIGFLLWLPILATNVIAQASLVVNGLRCEYRTNPLDVDSARPRLSWVLQSTERAQVQTAYQVLAATSAKTLTEEKADLWDSGRVTGSQMHLIAYEGKPPISSQQVYWKVRVWDGDGTPSSWSDPATWTMGLLRTTDWHARWILHPADSSNPSDKPALRGLPIFRKAFTVNQPARRALIYVCGLGQHELFLNGRKAGDRFLDPAWSIYDKTTYYTTYDVTADLNRGVNAIGIMLGKGFYSTAGDRRVHGVNVQRPLKVILQAHIELADGSRQRLITDESWRVTDGPITHCAILGGSDYDARRLPNRWTEPGFDDSHWSTAQITEGPGGALVACPAPPMKTYEVFAPVRIDRPEPGVYVYDFGQNASAVPHLHVRGKPGQVLRLTPAEQRFGQTERANDGRARVNQAGVGQPNYWEYTLRGGGIEVWSPQFTYSGFQYLELTGAAPQGESNPSDLPVVKELLSRHVRNACPTAGSFACSKPLFNDIHRLVDWAVRSNMGHVLTDCPHREKLGWLEVSYLMEPSIACRYDIARFYTKVTRDIRDSQGANGAIYTVAPNYPAFSGGFRYTPEWGAAGVILPWQIHHRYGDRRILEDNYATMKRFVDYMRDTSKDLVPQAGLGDWYDYGHGQGNGPARFTPPELTAMVTFYRCTQIVAQTAELLDQDRDRTTYTTLARQVKQKFNATYFNGRDEYQNHGSPQTSSAMALVTGMVPSECVPAVVERMVADIRTRNHQQTAGDIGFSYLVQALAEHRRSDVLFDITNRRDLGSYGFIRDRGWTSLPEAWDANTGASMNHCMLGHIQQWFYANLAGIQCDPSAVGFKKIVIRPEIVGDLTWVKAHHDSVSGTIHSAWQRKDSTLSLRVTIPANTSATIYIPTKTPSTIREGDTLASESPGVTFIQAGEKCAVFAVDSGCYHFTSALP